MLLHRSSLAQLFSKNYKSKEKSTYRNIRNLILDQNKSNLPESDSFLCHKVGNNHASKQPRRNIITNTMNEQKPKGAKATFQSVNVFDRNAKRFQREKAAKDPDYHLYEYIKEEIGWRVADRVFDVKRTFNNAVDLGCSRGYVSRNFTPDSVSHVTLCDWTRENLNAATVGEGVQSTKLLMDEENLELPDNSVDLLVSSLCLHWVNDLPGCFDRIMQCLKPDGVFIGSIFGGDTLFELRQALQLADSERLGGLIPHISPFAHVRDVGSLLTASGFTMLTVDVENMKVWYPSAWQVMGDVRGMGESAAAHSRPLHLSRDVQFAAEAIYRHMYGEVYPKNNEIGVPATFQVIHFVGWKPHASQPKPLQRGSGQVSLKDIGNLDKIVKEVGQVPVQPDDERK